MGLLVGKINISDDDLAVIEAIVGRFSQSLNNLAGAGNAIAQAVEVVAKVIGAKKASAFWGLIKIE